MTLQVTARNTEVSRRDRAYLEKKIPRLERLCKGIDELEVVFIGEKKTRIVEINFRSGPIRLFTRADGESATAAIDRAMDKLQARISKARSRKFGNKMHATQTIRVTDERLDEESEEAGA